MRRRDREALQPPRGCSGQAVVLISGAVLLLLGAIGALLLLEGRQSRKSGGARGGRGPWITRVSPRAGASANAVPSGASRAPRSLLPSNSTTWLPTDRQLLQKSQSGLQKLCSRGYSGGFQGSPSQEGASQPGASTKQLRDHLRHGPSGLALLTLGRNETMASAS